MSPKCLLSVTATTSQSNSRSRSPSPSSFSFSFSCASSASVSPRTDWGDLPSQPLSPRQECHQGMVCGTRPAADLHRPFASRSLLLLAVTRSYHDRQVSTALSSSDISTARLFSTFIRPASRLVGFATMVAFSLESLGQLRILIRGAPSACQLRGISVPYRRAWISAVYPTPPLPSRFTSWSMVSSQDAGRRTSRGVLSLDFTGLIDSQENCGDV